MKRVRNLRNNTISTVTGGNIGPFCTAEVQDWEANILTALYKVSVEEAIKTKKKKK